MTFLGEKKLANFRKSRTEGPQKHENSKTYQDRPGMSEAHLALIRKMPCTVCPKMPGGEAHHLKDTPDKDRGMGVRSTDKWAVPLCHEHHIHGVERAGTKNEHAWFKERGIENVVVLASDLWKITGNLPQMVKVLMAHRGHK